MRIRSFSLVLAGLFLSPALADWPQFRGPDGQGHSPSRDLPLRWSEKENVRWKTALPGRGWSSPVIADGKIWLTTATEEGKSLRAICVDQETGRVLHNVEVFAIKDPPRINLKNSYASPTPVLDAGRLFVHFGTLGTACLDATTGKVLWTNQDLKLDHKEGPGSSPIVWRNLLVVNCDGMDVQYVAALDVKTGRLVWKATRTGIRSPNPDFRKAYSTPLVIKVAGKEQLVSVGADRTSAHDPETGKEIWWVDYNGFSNVPRPVYGHGMVFICTGFLKPEVWAVRVEGKGDVTRSGVAWREFRLAPYNSSPLLVGDILYTVSDQGILAARAAKTGRILWTERLGSAVCASPVCAGGRIYVCDEDGRTSVVKSGRAFELLARNALDGRLQASPAIVGRALFLRTETHLYRIEERAK